MKKTHSSKIFIFPATLLSVTALSSLIASSTHTYADISDSVDDNITITVDSSCLMGQSIVSDHTTQLNPGEMNSTIGESRIRGYCNDTNGYAIYAIGYTNGELGNTNLLSTGGNIIATGTSGANSYWNMKLTPASSGSYTPNVVSPFTNNTTIPTEYTKVAYFDSFAPGPTSGQNTISDSYIATTYETHLSATQPSGVYYGQVQYVLVHPSSAPAPIFMQDTNAIKARLTNVGDTIQAIDKRDGKWYWVTKLADGNIWMTQNLDLDIKSNKTYTYTDTDLPLGSTWTPIYSTYTDATWTHSYYDPQSYDPGNRYWNGTILPQPGTDITGGTSTSGDTHYHIGNYYNWSAAIATNNSIDYSTPGEDANRSICPAGWRLPAYSDNKSYQKLVDDQVLTPGTIGNIQKSPTYFPYAGYWDGTSYFIGDEGGYWYGIPTGNYGAYQFDFDSDGNFYVQGTDGRNNGAPIRCVIR